MEYDGKGIVTSVSNNSCDVSVCINGTRSLSFCRSVFYSFGVRCEGSMANILEEGMEVELCYKISHPDKPCIVAVWVGDKPDSFNDVEPDSDEYSDVSSDGTVGKRTSSAIYDKVGCVTAVDTDTVLVQSDSYKVVISKDVVFRDFVRLDKDGTLDIHEEIIFDATPCESEDPSGASHRATCAWIGQQPRLVDRFHLDSMDGKDRDMELEVLERHEIYGTVVVIPSEVVALVEVEFESALFKVMLFRNSFKPACERIQDVVDVGDTLRMRLRYRYLFPGCQQWFAAKAVKDDACDLNSVESCVEEDVKPTEKSDCFTGGIVTNKNMTDLKYVVLYDYPPLAGTLSPLPFDCACVKYKDFKIFVGRDNFYENGGKGSVSHFMFVSPSSQKVYFEAVPSKLKDFTHEATCVWVGNKPDVNVIVSSMPPPKLALLENKGQVYYGIVSKLCLPRVALVLIPEESTTVVISVPLIVSKPFFVSESGKDLISSYIRLNDVVQFKLMCVTPTALSGWDVHVLEPKEAREKMNKGVFVSMGHRGRPDWSQYSTIKAPDDSSAHLKTAVRSKRRVKRRKANAKNATAKNATVKSVTAKNAMAKNTTAKNATANDANAKNATAKNATAKNTTAKNATANDANAKKALAKNATAKNATAKNAIGTSVTAKNATAKNTTAKNATAKNAIGTSVTAKNATAKNTTAKNATAKNATGKSVTAKNATAKNATAKIATANNANNTPAKKATAKSVTAKNATAKSVTAKNATAKSVTAKNATAKNANAKNATAKSATAKNAMAKGANAKNVPAKNGTAKSATTTSVTAKSANAKSANAKCAPAKNATAKKNPTSKNAPAVNSTKVGFSYVASAKAASKIAYSKRVAANIVSASRTHPDESSGDKTTTTKRPPRKRNGKNAPLTRELRDVRLQF